jgi:prepilin signal peptidase PulO-like enzyme (type II secretory pathway)
MGRSECPHCHHTLTFWDLFPLLSYLWNRGKCSHCGMAIPLFYPMAEILMGCIFAIGAYAGIRI